MQIISYNHGKAVLFSSGIIIIKSSADYYQFYVTQFKDFKLTKSAIKTARKSHFVGDEKQVSFTDIINIGLEYFKGVHQVRWDHLTQNQSAILDLVKGYVLPEVKQEENTSKQNEIEVLEMVVPEVKAKAL